MRDIQNLRTIHAFPKYSDASYLRSKRGFSISTQNAEITKNKNTFMVHMNFAHILKLDQITYYFFRIIVDEIYCLPTSFRSD